MIFISTSFETSSCLLQADPRCQWCLQCKSQLILKSEVRHLILFSPRFDKDQFDEVDHTIHKTFFDIMYENAGPKTV